MPIASSSEDVERAERLARHFLVRLGDRWAHTQGVARAAASAAATVAEEDRDCLVAAGWLHDIGYARDVAHSGFHALDGAREVMRLGFNIRIAALVAHHSMSAYEATARGLRTELEAFPKETGRVSDALVWADMTIGPTGDQVTAEDRTAEILQRYAPGDPVHSAIQGARAEILSAVRRTEDRLNSESSRHPM